MPYSITEERRNKYRASTVLANSRKRLAAEGGLEPEHDINCPVYQPMKDMPKADAGGLTALSLFSGGGGLDLGFDRAGFRHVASFDNLEICGETLKKNRPEWEVYSGEAGDVRGVRWKDYSGLVDVIHGGPPCQPFSAAGRQLGEADERNMWPAFVDAVIKIRPMAFVAENVAGLLAKKFEAFVERNIFTPLSQYQIRAFVLDARDFGVPQTRRRVFFVGFRKRKLAQGFKIPVGRFAGKDARGVRHALGLPDIGFDCVAPTLRSGFTGPRNTTGVVNSRRSLEIWGDLQIWPNGVQATRQAARAFPAENGHFRLSVKDCALIQGFPNSWEVVGPVYKQLGQIGNSVSPPVAYAVARSIADGCSG